MTSTKLNNISLAGLESLDVIAANFRVQVNSLVPNWPADRGSATPFPATGNCTLPFIWPARCCNPFVMRPACGSLLVFDQSPFLPA